MRSPCIPEGVAEARALADRIDGCLASGLARLTPEQVSGMKELVAAFEGTPLGQALGASIDKLAAGELLAHHMAVLAAARASLEGARADALLAEAASALDLVLEQPECEPPPTPSDAVRVRMEGAQQWLVEVALAGFEQLDVPTLMPVQRTLTGIQERPELQGLAALLTGFATELLDAAPTSALPELPLRRWSDLWTQCMLATCALPSPVKSRKVTGQWSPLGADIRHHDHYLSVVVHGLLEEGGQRRLVRTTVSAWKVDAIVEAEIWHLLSPVAPAAIDGLARPLTLKLTDATLYSTGDLRWDGKVSGGTAFDPFSADLSGAILSAPAPRDRHSLQIAVPRVLSSCKVTKNQISAGSLSHRLDLGRVSPHSDLEPAEVSQSESLVGLLRFDDDWALQPLAGKKGKTVFGPAQGIAEAAKLKKASLGVLKERASKLLRAG